MKTKEEQDQEKNVVPRPNWIDRTVSVLFPQYGLKRAKARYQLHQYDNFRTLQARSYEAAKKGRRNKGWKGKSTSANLEIRSSVAALRAASREATRNNPYIGRAQSAYVDNVIGTGIRFKINIDKNEALEKKVMNVWRKWALTSACDYDGKLTLHGLQDVAEHTLFESGEVFVVKRTVKGAVIPLKLQLLEPEHVDVNMNETLPNKNKIKQGIEFNSKNKIVAYWFYKDHPHDDQYFNKSHERIRIKAKDVCHVYDVLRAGQLRGLPSEMARVLVRLNDLDDYEQGQILKQKISAAFAAFVYDTDGTGSDIASPDEETDEAGGLEFDTLQPGIIQELPAGKNVSFSDPPKVDGYGEFVGSHLHAISAGSRVPYEILTHNYSDVNFSSARMSWNEFQRIIDRRQSKIYKPMMLEPIAEWFKEAYFLAFGADLSSGVCTWTPQRRFQVDPTKEIPVMIKEIRAGLQSYEGALIERGFDPDEKIREIVRGFERMEKEELILDCDPRKKDLVGQTQEEDADVKKDSE